MYLRLTYDGCLEDNFTTVEGALKDFLDAIYEDFEANSTNVSIEFFNEDTLQWEY